MYVYMYIAMCTYTCDIVCLVCNCTPILFSDSMTLFSSKVWYIFHVYLVSSVSESVSCSVALMGIRNSYVSSVAVSSLSTTVIP